MGRYTTVQTYTDQDAKVAALAYTTATTTGESNGEGAGAGVEASAASNKAVEDANDEDKFHMNRVDNVSGSSAGAGSGDFHMYRAARRRELERVAHLEKEHAKRKDQEDFETKRKRNMEEFEARAQKRAEKRRRRKDRAKARSLDDGSEDEGGEPKEDKEKPGADDDKPLPETPGGVPEIPNDGSFLERMLAMQQQLLKDDK
ncbi:hypothetical protein Poli38472_000667 [Pythium oligandrum]|uniref:PRKR-interacting protein 1 n=1 Tax=Pythium oligandrum TaxID=41045 RepID=A0A8K1CCJ1_PYTOL|nr:hypothetical protein Poli38472_000667 [Pythium oligandrum]|eukprot:TMW60625.1 hypothetical protein Poli38472_000667 [Pythium oligandrum]